MVMSASSREINSKLIKGKRTVMFQPPNNGFLGSMVEPIKATLIKLLRVVVNPDSVCIYSDKLGSPYNKFNKYESKKNRNRIGSLHSKIIIIMQNANNEV